MGKLGRVALLAGGIAVLVAAGGFVGFAEGVVDARPPADARADGIVVLTGGTARIDGALSLLAERRASRLLISGVNPVVTRDVLAGRVDGSLRDELLCCVDLGHAARDTIGNAAETRDWAEAHNFASLIVVTSDYHMARSMTELATAMPRMELIAFPVTNPELHLSRWWREPGSVGLLLREYAKFLAAVARQALGGRLPAVVADNHSIR
jgi:uncharacterized SAM-binding protein YcdF (DUF218 family)